MHTELGPVGPTDDTLISAGVDWITAVALEEVSSLKLSLLASTLMRHQVEIGNLKRAWGMAGFTGFAAGQVQFGMRGDETILRLSSGTAEMHWKQLYRESDRVTRIDVQATLRTKLEPRDVIQTHWDEARIDSGKHKRGPSVSLVTSNDGSDTCYLGKRSSCIFGRIYNKGIESKLAEYKRCVRYEVEYKGKASILLARRLAQASSSRSLAVEYIHSFLLTRGVVSPFSSSALHQLIVSRTRTDTLRRLEWLRKQARGSANVIVTQGMGAELLKALGLEIDDRGELRVSGGPTSN